MADISDRNACARGWRTDRWERTKRKRVSIYVPTRGAVVVATPSYWVATAAASIGGSLGRPGRALCQLDVLAGAPPGPRVHNMPHKFTLKASWLCEPSALRNLCTSDGSRKPVRDHVGRSHIDHICRQRCNLRPFENPTLSSQISSPWGYASLLFVRLGSGVSAPVLAKRQRWHSIGVEGAATPAVSVCREIYELASRPCGQTLSRCNGPAIS